MLSEKLPALSDELGSKALGVRVLSLESALRLVQAESRKAAHNSAEEILIRRFIFFIPLYELTLLYSIMPKFKTRNCEK